MDSKTLKKVTWNTAAQMGGKVIGTLLGLATIAMITRYLGILGFGQYTTIMAYLQFFGIFVDLGLTLTTTQMISVPNANINKIVSNIFSLRVVTSIVILGIAPLCVVFFPYPPVVKIGISIATLSFFFISLQQVFVGVFQKFLVTQKAAISEIINRILLFVFVWWSVVADWGLMGIIWAIILSNLTHFTCHFYFAKPYIKLRWEIDLNLWKKIWTQTWPIAITIIFNLLYFKADTLILSIYHSQETVGIYGAPYKVLEVLTTVPYILSGLILPLLTKSYLEKNKESFKKIFQTGFDMLSSITLPMIFGTWALATPIMEFIAGKEFTSSGILLKILILATGIIFLTNISSHAIIAINAQKKIIPAYVFTAIISLSAYFLLIPQYGAFAAAWLTVFAESLMCFFIFLTVYKESQFIPQFKKTAEFLLASIVMYQGIILLTPLLSFNAAILLLCQVSLGIGFYSLTLLFLKTLNKNHLSLFFQKKI